MEQYLIEGFYLYNGDKGKLTGEIELNSKGEFESIILDHMSRVPEQVIKGRVHNAGDISRLAFFKYPATTSLANLAYKLDKQKSNDLSGNYTGKWGAMPYKVEFNQDLGLLILKTDLSTCRIGDRAEITLYRK